MYNRRLSGVLASLALALSVAGCGNSTFQQLGSSILSSTGVVSSSEADALFSAGGKLAKAATPLSEEEEYYLGRGVSAVILSQYKPLNNRPLQAYVNRVAAVVAANSGRPETYGGYHVTILDTPEINAVSAPGGFIFISKGLLDAVHSEDELAAVLAHEVGHIARGHGVSAISQANMTEAVTILGKQAAQSYGPSEVSELTSLFGDSVKDVADTLLKKGYSRSQEYEADLYSATVLKKAGYNPSALVSMLHSVEAREGKSPGGWMDTHPAAAKRIDEVQGEVKGGNGSEGEAIRTKRFLAAIGRKQ